jgi:hypothetical protein
MGADGPARVEAQAMVGLTVELEVRNGRNRAIMG